MYPVEFPVVPPHPPPPVFAVPLFPDKVYPVTPPPTALVTEEPVIDDATPAPPAKELFAFEFDVPAAPAPPPVPPQPGPVDPTPPA